MMLCLESGVKWVLEGVESRGRRVDELEYFLEGAGEVKSVSVLYFSVKSFLTPRNNPSRGSGFTLSFQLESLVYKSKDGDSRNQ